MEENVLRLQEKKRYFESKTARRQQTDAQVPGNAGKAKSSFAKSKEDALKAADRRRANEVKSAFAEYFDDKPAEVAILNTSIENLIRKTKEKHEDMSDILDLLRKVEIKFMRLFEMREKFKNTSEKVYVDGQTKEVEVYDKVQAIEKNLVMERKQENMKQKQDAEKRRKEEERVLMEEKRKQKELLL